MNSKNTKYRMNKLENLLIDVIMSVFIVLLLLFFVKNSSDSPQSSLREKAKEDLQGDAILKKEEFLPKPRDDEANQVKGESIRQKEEKKERVNINTADLEELKTLSGIGDSTAKSIIAYREEHGAFKKISDLKRVSGIGEAKFNKIKDSICVE